MVLFFVALFILAWSPALRAESLTLEECIARTLANNLDLRQAGQGLDRAQADLKAARANRLPNASTTLFGFTRSRTGSSIRTQDNPTSEVDPVSGQRIFREEETLIPGVNRNSFAFSANLNHTLYDGGRQRHTYKSSRESLQGVAKDLEASQLQVIFAVKQQYYQLLKALELVEVQQEALNLSGKRLEEAQARLDVGAGTQVDVLRLQVSQDNDQAALINTRQSVVLARTNLNFLMGASLQTPLEPVPLTTGDWDFTTPSSLDNNLVKAQQQNPALLRQRQSVLARQYDLKATRSAWHPRLTGSLSYSRNNETFDRVYGEVDKNYRLNAGVTLSYELFDGGTRRANTARARANLESARTGVEQQERQIALNVETAYLEIERLQKILAIAERTVTLAREDLRLAEERYRVGKGRLLETLDAQVGFTQVRSNLVRTRYDLKIAEADLKRQLGER
jgi:outer membrane protein